MTGLAVNWVAAHPYGAWALASIGGMCWGFAIGWFSHASRAPTEKDPKGG